MLLEDHKRRIAGKYIPKMLQFKFASSHLSSSSDGGVADPAGEKSESGERPDKSENPKAGVAGLRPSGIAQQLGHLQPVVREVVDDEDQGAHPVHVVAPAEGEQGEGGHVVDEHLPEVLDAHIKSNVDCFSYLSLHVKELGKEEGPVEGHL